MLIVMVFSFVTLGRTAGTVTGKLGKNTSILEFNKLEQEQCKSLRKK